MSSQVVPLPGTVVLPYVRDPYQYRRRPTHVVMVGDIGVGGDHPIRVQSMTTTLTSDIDATVAQSVRLVDAGCEIVRVTTPSTQDARALGEIKRQLRAAGVRVPLVADIHFNPASAMEAANYADKVRINPGNYADKKSFAVREYTDSEYQAELERIAERFRPLVRRCLANGVSMRIGTNHGSLSDRIMNRFGDTPEGMVESALEFVRICEAEGYRDVIFSMKASNPKVMVQAYRLLVARLDAAGMTYPLHLGVTEAGGGQDGRIKSAIGIGALLEDGLGDTIRVSLTEEPEAEIPVALALARRYASVPSEVQAGVGYRDAPDEAELPDLRDPYRFSPRPVAEFAVGPVPFGGRRPARVVVPVAQRPSVMDDPALVAAAQLMPVGAASLRPDLVRVAILDDADVAAAVRFSEALGTAVDAAGMLIDVSAAPHLVPAVAGIVGGLWLTEPVDADWAVFDAVVDECIGASRSLWYGVPSVDDPQRAETASTADAWRLMVERLIAAATRARAGGLSAMVLTVSASTVTEGVWAARLLDSRLRQNGLETAIHLVATASDDYDAVLLGCSLCLGASLIDGIGHSVEINGPLGRAGQLRLAFDILQGAGARATKTEFIACPSCGRTLFDLQTTTARIQQRMSHLVGVKIAVMGCVVNGLGELADADFGYMGSGIGKVNLYVGKDCVAKNLPAEEADERLVELIKAHGRWTEPTVPVGLDATASDR